jgi:hypothetical protein
MTLTRELLRCRKSGADHSRNVNGDLTLREARRNKEKKNREKTSVSSRLKREVGTGGRET